MDAPEASADLSVALYHRTASPDPRGAPPGRPKLNDGAKTQRIDQRDRGESSSDENGRQSGLETAHECARGSKYTLTTHTPLTDAKRADRRRPGRRHITSDVTDAAVRTYSSHVQQKTSITRTMA